MTDTTFTEALMRIDEDSHNLFIRLSPDIFHSLLESISGTPLREDIGTDCPYVFQSGNPGIFLPLELSVGGSTLYVSFNGGILHQSLNTIEVPSGLLLDIPDGQRLAQLKVLHSVSHARRVLVEPVAIEDWEMMQVHAESFENGAILEQVSIVHLQQCLVFRIQCDIIHLVLKEITISHPTNWPGLDEFPRIAMMVSNTELVVNPKPRNLSANEWSKDLQLIPCVADLSEATLDLQEALACPRLDVALGCVLVSNEIGNLLHGDWAVISFDGDKDRHRLVRVAVSKYRFRDMAALHPLQRVDLGLPLFWGSIRLCSTRAPTPVSMKGLVAEHVSMNPESSRLWYLPDIMLDDSTSSHTEANVEVQVQVGSVVPAKNQLMSGLDARKSLLRISSPNFVELESMDVFSMSDSLGFQDLPGEKQENTQLIQPQVDVYPRMVPKSIFESTTTALKPVLQDLRKGFTDFYMLCGETGTGKTHTALTLVAMAGSLDHWAMLYLDCKVLQEIVATTTGILFELDALFKKASQTRKCIIVLDDLDRLTPDLVGGDEGSPGNRILSSNPIAIEQTKLVSDRMKQLLESSNSSRQSVVVIATCATPNSVHLSLREGKKVIDVPELGSSDRNELLHTLLRTKMGGNICLDATDSQQIEGFRPMDLEKLASRTQRLLLSQQMPLSLGIEKVLEDFTPLSHLSLDQSSSSTELTWSQVGGLFDVKRKLESTLLQPMKYRAIYQRAGARLPRGILLFGPTGCGKSALVPALAEECSFPLISCKGPEILDKYIGASEARVRELFKQAALVAPSILFLDELDALAPRRGSDNTGVTDRVVNQLLTFLDGVEDTSKGTVYVIGATSRPDKVDPALLRPGRLELHLYVGSPQTDSEWIDLCAKSMKAFNLSAKCHDHPSSKTGIPRVLEGVRLHPLFCAADLKAALNTAHLKAVHRALSLSRAEEIEKVEIGEDDLKSAFRETKPCLSSDDAASLAAIYSRYISGKTPSKRTANNEPAKLHTTLR